MVNVTSKNENLRRGSQEPLSLDTRTMTENLKREVEATIRKLSNASGGDPIPQSNEYYFDANNNLAVENHIKSQNNYRSKSASTSSSGVTPPPSYGETRQHPSNLMHESSTLPGTSTRFDNLEYNILPQINDDSSSSKIEMKGMKSPSSTGGIQSSGRNVFEISYL